MNPYPYSPTARLQSPEEDKPEGLARLSKEGYTVYLDGYAYEGGSHRGDYRQLLAVSMLGPLQSLKAIWARLLKGEYMELSMGDAGPAHWANLDPFVSGSYQTGQKNQSEWTFRTAALPGSGGHHGLLLPKIATYTYDRPDFILLPRTEEEAKLLHLRYLNKRAEIGMLPEWADFFWTRGETTGELKKLRGWGLTAYRATPDLARLRSDVSLAIRTGALPVPGGLDARQASGGQSLEQRGHGDAAHDPEEARRVA